MPILLLHPGQQDQVGDAEDGELAGGDVDDDVDSELEDIDDENLLGRLVDDENCKKIEQKFQSWKISPNFSLNCGGKNPLKILAKLCR